MKITNNNLDNIKEMYNKKSEYLLSIKGILNQIQKEYDKLSYGEKIIWDCIEIYNDEFILPMYLYGKAIDPKELDRFFKEIVLDLKEQGIILFKRRLKKWKKKSQ